MTKLWYWVQGSQYPEVFENTSNEVEAARFRATLRQRHNLTSLVLNMWKLRSPMNTEAADAQGRLQNVFENLTTECDPLGASTSFSRRPRYHTTCTRLSSPQLIREFIVDPRQ
ncbi:hypothetical protein FRB94_005084 [Tulasnella sp. JGI-2019a]|nr:hypothetical protein FRB94_005084 [Tulasnella sp. JGI-2019a]KAG9008713.1 hypothetical protein FRB93_006259 [Tulasnella sp. JGI-2019a]KAG9032565.1 hypothetical protein FRB95_001230 [Tulasnella sp. JGI-2019a]